MQQIGKILIVSGLAITFLGLIFVLGVKLPGDVYIQRKNFSFYFPIATCIVLSVILTLIFWVFSRR